MGRPIIDLAGKKFGRLAVVCLFDRKAGQARWSCRCDCGKSSVVTGGNLRAGSVVSCGCFGLERIKATNTRHGMRRTPTYASWSAMIGRCQRRNDRSFADYGGRGIRVCDRWRTFVNFLADVGVRPAGTSIDRIDNDGNYEPGNVKWSTPKQQANNRRAPRIASGCLTGAPR